MEEASRELLRRGLLFDVAFAVASVLLSALQLAAVGDGAGQAVTSINCTPEVCMHWQILGTWSVVVRII